MALSIAQKRRCRFCRQALLFTEPQECVSSSFKALRLTLRSDCFVSFGQDTMRRPPEATRWLFGPGLDFSSHACFVTFFTRDWSVGLFETVRQFGHIYHRSHRHDRGRTATTAAVASGDS